MRRKKARWIMAMILFTVILGLTGIALADSENSNGYLMGSVGVKDFFTFDNSTGDNDELIENPTGTVVVNDATKPNSFHIEGFKVYDGQTFAEPLDAQESGSEPKWVAGEPFYIKITAQNTDDTVYACTYNNASGQTTVSGQITAVDGSGAPYDEPTFSTIGSLIDVPGSPGIGMAQAKFNEVGIITLKFTNNLEVASSSDPIGRFYPDHFTLVGTPVLQLRVDQGPSTSSSVWGYIGETMQVEMTLEACNAGGTLTQGYSGAFSKFSNVESGWKPAFYSGVTDYSDRLNFLNTTGDFNKGRAILTSTMTFDKSSLLQSKEVISGFTVSVNPTDADNVHLLLGPVQARVESATIPYTLYGGRIHVLGGYYRDGTVNVPVTTELWNGNKFVTNTLDSQTTVTSGGFTEVGGPPNVLIINDTFKALFGTGSLTVVNNGGNNITRTLGQNGAYPSYLDLLSGTLAWGKILSPGGPLPASDGIIWESEKL